jgi:hypothetical protein
MFYTVEFLRPTVYNWCTSLLANMKSQLTDLKEGMKRDFGFSYILCSFFFERVPGLIPRVEIIPHGPHDLAMSWWTEVMRRLGGGRVPTPYNYEFFFWWRRQVIAIGDYPYAFLNYRGDANIPFPPDSTYGDVGMNFFIYFIFLCFSKRVKNTNIWMVSSIDNYFVTQMWFHDNQMDSHDIGGGTRGMSQWEEMQRECYKICRGTCLI